MYKLAVSGRSRLSRNEAPTLGRLSPQVLDTHAWESDTVAMSVSQLARTLNVPESSFLALEPTDALQHCTALLPALHLNNIDVRFTEEVAENAPLTVLVVNGDVIPTESFATLTATVSGQDAPTTVQYTARQGEDGVEAYRIELGSNMVVEVTARQGAPALCVSGSTLVAHAY